MNITKVLNEFGLTINTSKVYLSCLKMGNGTIMDITRTVMLPRTSVYEALQTLVKLGLLVITNRGVKKIYTAVHPEKLKKILKTEERHLNYSLPELLSLYQTGNKKPVIKFYDNTEGIKTVLEDSLTSKNKLLRFILSVKDLYQIPGEKYMTNYVNKRKALGIKIQVIRSAVKDLPGVWPSSHQDLREVHYVPDALIFPLTFCIYDNKLAVVSSKKENFGLIIESEELYQTIKSLFDIMWQITKFSPFID